MCDMLCTSPFEAWGEQCLVMLHASLFPYLLSGNLLARLKLMWLRCIMIDS